MAAKTNRSLLLPVRVTPAEKALLLERAGGPGKLSAYLRELGLTGKPPSAKAADRPETAARTEGPQFEQRVRAAARRMSRRNAENLVRSEEARERS